MKRKTHIIHPEYVAGGFEVALCGRFDASVLVVTDHASATCKACHTKWARMYPAVHSK